MSVPHFYCNMFLSVHLPAHFLSETPLVPLDSFFVLLKVRIGHGTLRYHRQLHLQTRRMLYSLLNSLAVF